MKSSNGIAFAEFKGYDAWQLIATSQHDGTDGCGTSTTGCAKAILGNPIMIQAYRDGFPANGKPVPDGAAMAKIEWLKDTNKAAPYQITVPGVQTEVAFMVKDSKRFPDTNGWGYATLQYDAASNTYKPKAGQSNPSFARPLCHACHTAARRRPTSSTPPSRGGNRHEVSTHRLTRSRGGVAVDRRHDHRRSRYGRRHVAERDCAV